MCTSMGLGGVKVYKTTNDILIVPTIKISKILHPSFRSSLFHGRIESYIIEKTFNKVIDIFSNSSNKEHEKMKKKK